jgi:hypothetical protein
VNYVANSYEVQVDEPWVVSWCGLLNQTRSSGRRDEDNQKTTTVGVVVMDHHHGYKKNPRTRTMKRR